MAKFKTSNQVLEECQRDAFFKLQEGIDIPKICTMRDMALSEFHLAQRWNKNLSKEGYETSTIFKLYYDVFRELVDAFIRFDRVKSLNHHCLFAHLIEKHPELEFDWNTLEEIRNKRNGIQYYGTPITYAEWKRLELFLNLYISTILKALEQKLKTGQLEIL